MHKKLLITLILLSFLPVTTHAGFIFGFHPEFNDTNEIVTIEKKYNFRSSATGYIFDTFSESDAEYLRSAIHTLGKDRIYHVTISPFGLSARDVANGKYDTEYGRFFLLVKTSGAKFIFRTMHEMNGSWYSWSGDPESFRRAWIHLWGLSRQYGLDDTNILFTFSVNSQDLPSIDGSVNGSIVYCSPEHKKTTGCITFEDFYPWDRYVDLMGMTVYNWGRGRSESWARWRSFEDILTDPEMHTFDRLKGYGKKIFIDEMGTTAVDFEGEWSRERVRDVYYAPSPKKNAWMREAWSYIATHDEITGALYFNRDRTQRFLDWSLIGELDWAALSPHTGRAYRGVLDLASIAGSGAYAPIFEMGQIHTQVERAHRTIFDRVVQKSEKSGTIGSKIVKTHLLLSIKQKLSALKASANDPKKQLFLDLLIRQL